MIRMCKIAAILFVGTIAAEALFVVPTRDMVAILIVVMAVTMQFSRGPENDFRAIFYVSALSAIGFLYFGQAAGPTNVVAAKPVAVTDSEPSITTTFNQHDDSMTMRYSGEYRRPLTTERKQQRQESPKAWQEQLHERVEQYKSDKNLTN